MFKNRKGEWPAWLTFVLIGILAIFILSPTTITNFLSGLSGGTTPEPGAGLTDTDDCPTSGITTLTLNVQDELATTATNVGTEYYVFNGQKLLAEGATGSDGSVSFDLNCGKNTQILLVNTTTGSGSGGYYAKVVDYNARIAADTLNAELVKIGGGNIIRMINPNYVDTTAGDTNMTLAAEQTKGFQIQFEANGTASGYNHPTILCEANITTVQTMALASFDDGTSVTPATLPSRVSTTTGKRYYAWEYGKMLQTSDGSVTATGTITAATTAPSTGETIQCKIIDKAYWKIASYKTTTSPEQAFLFGAENTETIADVGGTDSSTRTINIGTEAN